MMAEGGDGSNNQLEWLVQTPFVGHHQAEAVFLDAFHAERLHHAWLITGPRGIGKASLSWRIAYFMAINGMGDNRGKEADMFASLKAPAATLDVDPDHAISRRIRSGAYSDIRLVDCAAEVEAGKSGKEIGVAQIRSLIHFFNQTTGEGGWRIAIIDAVDELTNSAANSLLKLLEEPPAKCLLLLVCHAPGQVLPTITSRCRRLNLAPVDAVEMQSFLKAKFGDMPDAALALAALLSEGAPGRASAFVEAGGLELYRDLKKILDPKTGGGPQEIHQFAAALSAAKSGGNFTFFPQLLKFFLEEIIKYKSTNRPNAALNLEDQAYFAQFSDKPGLEIWLSLWKKTAQRFERLEAINLERRAVIVTLLSEICHLTKMA